jgi:L-asparaginase II
MTRHARTSSLSVGAPLAEVTRRDERSGDELVESMHHGHLVIIGPGPTPPGPGAVPPPWTTVASLGDPEALTFVRSAAKPFQTVAALELLGARADELSDAEVAVSWGSHRGEPRHLQAVARLLERSGRAPAELTCPPAVAEADPGAAPTRIQHNCSGKHALFALAATVLGTSRETLLDRSGALQQYLLEELSQRMTVVAVGIDGCGAPAVASPLWSLATAYAGLANLPWGERVRDAGYAHPLTVGGQGRLESALLAAGVMAKSGAEGVYAVGWSAADGGDWGLACKATDGSARGAAAATIAVLEGLAVVPDGTWLPPPPLGGGAPVGRVRATSAVARIIERIGGAAAR